MTRKQWYFIIGGAAVVIAAVVLLVVALRMRATADLDRRTNQPSNQQGNGGTVVEGLDTLAEQERAMLEARPIDTDGDGLSDDEEGAVGTNPAASDTDGDGYTDYEEVKLLNSDPRTANAEELRERQSLEEIRLQNAAMQEGGGEDAAEEPSDTDGDGVSDETELRLGTDSNKRDTDEDALTDLEEVAVFQTDPTRPDTDGDGFPDGDEVQNGYNPRGPGACENPDCTP